MVNDTSPTSIYLLAHFDVKFLNKSASYGGGKYNASAAAEVRWARIQDSLARNPNFTFTTPRYFTAYAESVFPYRFFVDGRDSSTALNLTVARGFFQDNHFPTDFYRRSGSFGLLDVGIDIFGLEAAHPISPGYNVGAGNYVVDAADPGFAEGVCASVDSWGDINVINVLPYSCAICIPNMRTSQYRHCIQIPPGLCAQRSRRTWLLSTGQWRPSTPARRCSLTVNSPYFSTILLFIVTLSIVTCTLSHHDCVRGRDTTVNSRLKLSFPSRTCFRDGSGAMKICSV